jgi:hypothetical protein
MESVLNKVRIQEDSTLANQQATWSCDTCGEPIEGVQQGWVEWLYATDQAEEGAPPARGLRLVHARPDSPRESSDTGCQYDGIAEYRRSGYALSDLALDRLTGPDGLMRLLYFAEASEIPTAEAVELIKRLHIPGYEQARPYLEEGISVGAVHPSIHPGVYSQEQIEDAMRYAEERDQY